MTERFKITRRVSINKIESNKMSKSFSELDAAMNAYYKSVGRDDYYIDHQNSSIGKLSKYCKANGIDIDDIADELKYDPLDSLLVDFDDKFPFHSSHLIQTQNEQTMIKYNIIKHCYQNGKAPSLPTTNDDEKSLSPSLDTDKSSPSPPNPLDHKVMFPSLISQIVQTL